MNKVSGDHVLSGFAYYGHELGEASPIMVAQNRFAREDRRFRRKLNTVMMGHAPMKVDDGSYPARDLCGAFCTVRTRQ